VATHGWEAIEILRNALLASQSPGLPTSGVATSMYPLVHAGKVHLVFCTDIDVTRRIDAEKESFLADQLFEQSHDAILIADQDWRILAINKAYTDLTGNVLADVRGALAPHLPSARYDNAFYDTLRRQVHDDRHWQGEVWSERPGGELFPLWVSLTAILNPEGEVGGYTVVLSDISARKRDEEATRYLAEHDFLTGLPNRVLLLDRLQQCLAAARREGKQMALMYLDLDHFKAINDTHGHAAGDAVLKEVAQRLMRSVRGADTVSRQGGDEFVVVLDGIGDAEDAAHIAGNIMEAIAGIDHAGGVPIKLSTSIGISLYPSDGPGLETLLHHADVAMYHAKQGGRQGYRFYSPEMNAHVQARRALEDSMRLALAADQFELDYLPALAIATGRVTCVEVLLRWRHPQHGRLLPHQFLPVAEESGMIVEIGQWVLREACRRARRWQDAGTPICVSVNLSSGQLEDRNFGSGIDMALLDAGIAPHLLDLELRESLVLAAGAEGSDTLDRLSGQGVRLTLDNFGIGAASLAAVQRCRFSRIKIDRSLVGEIGRTVNPPPLVPAIIALGHSLNVTVLAEGVESEGQLDVLRQLGCDDYQGRLVPDQVMH
jgi:diguanylate cyclase (GGDEF)-like protein/PAS domain S-box-containing protein